MISSRPHLVLALAVVAGLLAVTIAGSRLSAATARARSAHARLEAASRDAAEVLTLRSTSAVANEERRPDSDLYAAARAASVSAGLPPQTVRDLAQESDAPVQGRPGDTAAQPPRRRQSVRLTLEPIDPAGLGRFLAAWRAAQPQWAVARIDLQARRPRTPAEPAGTYTARLVVSATYLEPAAPPTHAP